MDPARCPDCGSAAVGGETHLCPGISGNLALVRLTETDGTEHLLNLRLIRSAYCRFLRADTAEFAVRWQNGGRDVYRVGRESALEAVRVIEAFNNQDGGFEWAKDLAPGEGP